MEGTRIAHYNVLEKLGAGGMGAVYLAEDERLGRRVALKVLPPSMAEDDDRRSRFQREARAIAALNHPNIVTVFSVEEHDDVLFMTMERVEGTTLDRLWQGTPALADVLEVAVQVADALSAAHRRGIVHRDLKPSNIMVSPEGRVKVLDFGLAKFAKITGTDSLLASAPTQAETEAGMMLGTIQYMSPEQLQNKPVDPRSDLYSFGTMLYELAAGVHPFAAETLPEMIARMVREEPSPEPFQSGEKALLWPLLERCLVKDRTHRYPSSDELSDELRRLSERVTGTSRSLSSASKPNLVRRLFQTVLYVELEGDGNDRLEELESALRRAVSDHNGLAQSAPADLEEVGEQTRLATFDVPADAVRAALALVEVCRREGGAARVAIHLGDVVMIGGRLGGGGGDPTRTLRIAGRLTALALPNQILSSAAAFDPARREFLEREAEAASGSAAAGVGGHSGESSEDTQGRASAEPGQELAEDTRGGTGEARRGIEWRAHGAYLLPGSEDPFEVFEVGIAGLSPLEPPPDSGRGRRAVVPEEEEILGWRPAIGQEIPTRPGWELRAPLGSGGFGEVWLAEHRGLGTRRAFKFCFEAEQLRALKREVALFRLLQRSLGGRPDIARLLDWQIEDQPYFLESEYHGDGSLADWAKGDRSLDDIPLAKRLEIAARVADALAAAHSVGVLHKDVKPANILLAIEDGAPRVWLTDFGIGSLIEPEMDAEETRAGVTQALATTRSSSGSGTQAYMAPELLVGEPATIQSDLYSLGVVLFQLAVGDVQRALGHGWDRLIDDPELRDDIARCVDVDPSRRLASATELAERLRSLPERRAARLAAEREREESARLAAQRAEERRRRERRSFLAAVALALLALTGGALVWIQAERYREAVARSQEELLSQVLETNRAAAHWVARALERELWSATAAVERVASDRELRRMVAAQEWGGARDAPLQVLMQLRLEDYNGAGLFSMAFTDADGISRARAPFSENLYGRNFAYRDYFHGGNPEDAPIRSTYLSEPFVSRAQEGEAMVAVSTPVWPPGEGPESGSRPLGILLGTITLGHFADWIREIPEAVVGPKGADGMPALDVVLVNERGQLVVHPRNPLFDESRASGTPLPVWAPASEVPRGRSGAKPLADPLLEEPAEGQAMDGGYASGFARVSDDGWLVVVRALDLSKHPAQRLAGEVATMNRQFAIATVALIVGLLLVGGYLAAQLLSGRRAAG
ncbi:MAG TPA: protein kinase [Thermoanaerobaculia bacterium]|nr:protein kinase [Thermoanaerobaculia bacterium]